MTNLFDIAGIEDDKPEKKKSEKKPKKKKEPKKKDSKKKKGYYFSGPPKRRTSDECLAKSFGLLYGMTDDESIVSFQEARKFEDHRCPSCYTKLEIDQVNQQFVHPPIFWGCTQSSVEHRTAIKLLQQNFYKWKNKKKREICYEFICQKCGESSGQRKFANHLGGTFPDFTISNSKGQWAVDLALLDKDNANFMQAAIYRSYTHYKKSEAAKEISEAMKKVEAFAVIEIKSNKSILEELKKGIMLPWMEIEAKSILENPYRLISKNTSFQWHKCCD